MTPPRSLITAALIGTDRAGFPEVDGLPPALSGIHARLAAGPAHDGLFPLAGALALYDAAGQLPEKAAGADWRLPAFRPEGDRRPCSPAATRFLERMMNQQDTAHLPELLALLDASGRRPADDQLPYVLEFGAKTPRFRPQLLPILGERGRWLAAINPAWRYAAVDPGDVASLRGAWEADPAGRAALAATVRRQDPEKARRLIEATWRGEPEAARRELLAVLENGLSMSDEPFLERALDDRDALVRRKAADLLAALPGSRLVARVTAVAGSILTLRNGVLLPSFPGEITEAMVRDGMSRPESNGRHTGTRTAADLSRLLIHTVGVIPLAHWQERFNRGPEAIIAAAQAGKWPRTLLTALSTAALRQKDGAWTDALLVADGYSERTGMLLAGLPSEECYRRLAGRLAADDEAAVIVFLRRWNRPWDEASGRGLIDFYARAAAVTPDARPAPTLRFLSRRFAFDCPPSLAGYAAEVLRDRAATRTWEASLHYLLTILTFRREMRAAVTGED